MSRRARALLAAAIATVGLAVAPSAQAVNVDIVTTPFMNSATIEISGWEVGERNDLVLTPTGAVHDEDAIDPAFPLAPLSVLVTDRTTPLGDVLYPCVKVSANSARCTATNGVDTIDANIGISGGGGSFRVRPNTLGYTTPMLYYLQTSDGADDVSIPLSRGISMATLDGNDTITATDPSGVRMGVRINAGAGDDRVDLQSRGVTNVDCGDGTDAAQVVAANASVTNCETVTP